MTTMKRNGILTVVLAAVGVVAVLTTGAWRWTAAAVFVVLLAVIIAGRAADR